MPPERGKKVDDRPGHRKMTKIARRDWEILHLRKEPAPKTRWRNSLP